MRASICNAWRVDSDYLQRLPRGARMWMGQFEAEYYHGRFVGDGLDLHDSQLQHRVEQARNAAAADAVTKTADVARAHAARPLARKCDRHRYYSHDEYHIANRRGEEFSGQSPEDALIEAIDARPDTIY